MKLKKLNANKKLAYSVPEFCEAVSIGRTQIYKAIKEGKLVARKMGKRTVIEHRDGLNFIRALPEIAIEL